MEALVASKFERLMGVWPRSMARKSCWLVADSKAIGKCKADMLPQMSRLTSTRLGRYVGPRTEHLELIAPGLKYNTGFGLKMGLEVGAATAGSLSGMHVSAGISSLFDIVD